MCSLFQREQWCSSGSTSCCLRTPTWRAKAPRTFTKLCIRSASGTAFYAIVTGVILWLAALAGSWLENAAVYYDLSEAIAQHPLGLRLSERATKKFAKVVRHNIGGWSTSIVLGYLLGFTPVLGAFFGIPLDVRHVTLSTGTLALAAARFGTAGLGDRWFLYAVEGIAVVFVLNLTVAS